VCVVCCFSDRPRRGNFADLEASGRRFVHLAAGPVRGAVGSGDAAVVVMAADAQYPLERVAKLPVEDAAQ